MAAQPCRDSGVVDTCPICGRAMEDQRHVGVECFYDVHEVVPSAVAQTVLVEVPEQGRYWGITRRYPAGRRDRHVPSDGGATASGFKVIKVDVVQEPLPAVRLLEKPLFSVACCKACRADFLALFGRWASGEFAQGGNEDDTVRLLGAARLVGEDVVERLRGERDANDADNT